MIQWWEEFYKEHKETVMLFVWVNLAAACIVFWVAFLSWIL